MLKNRYTMPILLLYLLTSVAFLAIFSLWFYAQSRGEMVRDFHQNLIIIAHKVKFNLKDGLNHAQIREIVDDYSVNIAIDGEVVVREFEMPPFRGEFLVSEDFAFLRDFSRTGGRGSGRGGHESRPAHAAQNPQLSSNPPQPPQSNLTSNSNLTPRSHLMPNSNLAQSPQTLQPAPPAQFSNTAQPPHPPQLSRTPAPPHEIYIELMARLPLADFRLLALKIIAADAAILLIIFAIAYFLLRLSQRPFLAQIRRLNDFIADTTHEMNTPLCVILMSVEMFDKNPEKYLKNIKIASKNLNAIFNNLTSNLREEPREISLVNVKEMLISKAQSFEQNANDVSFCIRADAVVLLTDAYRLEKIIENLLSNAVKYAFSGSVVRLNLTRQRLEVTNDGEEISPKNIAKLYEKFSRFNAQSGVGGFGIGLNLVKRYCDELGFKISCHSADKKTTFCVELG